MTKYCLSEEKMLKLGLLAIALICFICKSECANILCYFNIALYSRHGAYRSFTRELANRGHELVVITTLPRPPAEAINNLTEIDVSMTSQNAITSRLLSEKDKYADYFSAFRVLRNHFLDVFEQQLQSSAIQNIIRNKHRYDILIVDSSYSCPTLALSHIFQIPVVLIRMLTYNFREHAIIGTERHALLYPYIISRNTLTNRTLWNAVLELYGEYQHDQIDLEGEKLADEMLKRNLGPKMPSLEKLWENVRAVIVNTHWIWDNYRPVPSNLVYVGNMHEKEENSLPKDIQAYLDSSTHGVIYMSFGSVLDFTTLPQAKIRIFLAVFSRLPYDIILKCNKNILKIPNNVKIYKWLPQTDILRHPKIKLFITQAGQHSTNEAISAGVPLLGVPMYSDQWYNAEQFVKHKVGVKIDLDSLTEVQLLSAINTVIKDGRYAAASCRLRKVLEHQWRPVERAALVVERVLREAAQDHPRLPTESHPELPLVAITLSAMVVILVLIRYLFKLCACGSGER